MALKLISGTTPFNINGRKKIDSLDVAEHDGQKYNKVNQIKCDLVLVSGGWTPVCPPFISPGSSANLGSGEFMFSA